MGGVLNRLILYICIKYTMIHTMVICCPHCDSHPEASGLSKMGIDQMELKDGCVNLAKKVFNKHIAIKPMKIGNW